MRNEEQEDKMEIVWQTPANPPQRQDYIFRDGIRYVRPYYFEFIAHAKDRWAGKTIVDLFADEFKGRSRDYYVAAVKAGRIQVDGKIVPLVYVVKPSQKISHFLHRHEPPVKAVDVKVLSVEPDALTVCKPASVPVHPCGQYRKNTVVGILQAEHNLAPLFPIHRLDRLVSGLLILARNASKADMFRQQIESGGVKKQYIARVIGVFPEDEQVADANINYNARQGKSTVDVSNNPNSDNLSKWKAARTIFTRISTNGTQSIVLCEPISGRTHQIRVHLQFLGHPIVNDLHYQCGCLPCESDERLRPDGTTAISGLPLRFNDGDTREHCLGEIIGDSDPMCTHCPNFAPEGYNVHEDGLLLHCVRYSGPGWTYECPYPDWASFC